MGRRWGVDVREITNEAVMAGGVSSEATMTLISHKYRFIFVKTRKTAGTSLEIALSQVMGGDDVIGPIPQDELARRSSGSPGVQNRVVPRSEWRIRDFVRAVGGRPPRFAQHSPAWFIKRSLPERAWQEYFKFTIERNSWDLAVSAHAWYEHRHQPGISFAAFLQSNLLEEYSNWRLYTIGDEVVVDHVIRYEDLPDGLEQVRDRLRLPASLELPRARSGHRPSKPYSECYDDAGRARVAAVFAREIEHFGYRFD